MLLLLLHNAPNKIEIRSFQRYKLIKPSTGSLPLFSCYIAPQLIKCGYRQDQVDATAVQCSKRRGTHCTEWIQEKNVEYCSGVVERMLRAKLLKRTAFTTANDSIAAIKIAAVSHVLPFLT